jgi:corrinoid protein of di/trimethylamine methyltransferase
MKFFASSMLSSEAMEGTKMSELLKSLQEAILTIDEETALEVTQELLDSGMEPEEILESGMTEALLELGRRWNCGEAFLPEVVAAAGIFERCSAIVEPALMAKADRKVSDKAIIATVKGDLHDLGKNIVGAMMKTVGLEVHDLGKNVPTEKIIEAVKELQPKIIGLSALLTTTMPEQEKVIKALEEAGLRSEVKVMVGGAPVTQEWADRIGADGYAPNAPEAVRVALELTQVAA